ncbi:MAG: type VI secretion system Vgr family protein [Sulfurimonas sp.]|uniref:type VI secretion system Vgr family protein n=1 Tax=Sulfurimonas sp. TaxID=2022749 RepID=UPI003D10BA65
MPRNPPQRIIASLELLEYNKQSIPALREGYSVYEIEGESGVLESYKVIVSFISDEAIALEDITDTQAKLLLQDENNRSNSRTIYGMVYEVKEEPKVASKYRYTLEIVSPLHYLSLNRHYEIFQEKSAPEIINEIITRYSNLLNLTLDMKKIDKEELPSRETTTQYAQSDYEFIKMLCEEEGLSLLVDSSTNNPYTLTLCKLSEHAKEYSKKVVCTYHKSQRFIPSNQTHNYYEKETPSQELKHQTKHFTLGATIQENEKTKQLRNDIKEYLQKQRVEKLHESLHKDIIRTSTLDANRAYAKNFTIKGMTHELQLTEGVHVELNDTFQKKSTQATLIKTTFKAFFPNALDEYTPSKESTPQTNQFTLTFEAIPKDILYIPPYTITKQKIHSIQTARVSAKKEQLKPYANEIDVNEKGEIRVIFHFDEKYPTSCYIPLANPFSGDGYGMQFLPRVNSEVIVSFINGDIDRPLIIGALHNAENHHPYNLPKEKTKSFIKTQTTPQYKDQEGYNELLFEDKQVEEQLNLRSQRYNNHKVLNNSKSHIDNNSINIIDNDMQLTIANNATTTIGNDQRNTIAGNQITTIEKEQLLSVGADQENHLLKNVTTIINQTSKTIIEQDLQERIKGKVNHYVEKDSQAKYLANLFMQIEKDLGIQITNAYHLQAKSIKLQSPTIELQATEGISLKCGGNVLTVDSSGIHIKTANYDSNATNSGVSAQEIQITDLAKPLYTKLRVVNLEASISKQETQEQLLTYTATVEKFENDAWTQTTDLTPTQKAQLQWFFIKNNDENDKDIITDNPTEDTIVIKDLEMSVTLNPNNIHRYAHVHCFVADPDAENGYVMSELKRYLELEDILIDIQDNDTKTFEAQAIYNVDAITQEEKALTCWIVEDVDVSDAKGKDIMTYAYKGKKQEILVKAYMESSSLEVAYTNVNFFDSEEEISGEIREND